MNVYRQIKTPSISADEQARRKRAIDFARGSVRYEGFVLSPEAEHVGERFVAGHLTVPEYVEAIKAIN
jgi:hypothetical protein